MDPGRRGPLAPGPEAVDLRLHRYGGPALRHGAAVADVKRVVRGMLLTPNLPSRARVDGPEIVRRRHVNDAVDDDRRGLQLLRQVRLKRPTQRQRANVVGRDLNELAVAPARVLAVERGPGVLGGIEWGSGLRDCFSAPSLVASTRSLS